ncbi:MAG: hypothetical protein ACU0A5_07765 [Salipiger marinus]|uniref:hypothetical protein n=1 Tax=Salipiger marinus TaxID=555512 RepID=UPI0040581184
MDDTLRKTVGWKVSEEGSVIELAFETIDGRRVALAIVPEAVTQLVGTLVTAKTAAAAAAAHGIGEADALDPVQMRQPIDAEKLVLTNYVTRGQSLVQIMTKSGGIFEFLIPLDGGTRRVVE